MDLKELLMRMGNTLVYEYGYEPATATRTPGVPSTHIVKEFTVWMNENPDAQEVLKRLGLDWSMLRKKGE